MDPAESAGRSALDVLIGGVFAPARFLDLIRSFVPVRGVGRQGGEGRGEVPPGGRGQPGGRGDGGGDGSDGRAGVVWHTQGSGKSYTMVFYVGKLRSDPRFENPTVVAVTDRTDLDTQLHETFARQRALAPAVEQAESIADLRARLERPAGGIVFTTIQKFQIAEGPMPVALAAAERDRDGRRGAPHPVRRARRERHRRAAGRDAGSGSPARRSRRPTARPRSSSATTSRCTGWSGRSRTVRPSRSTTSRGGSRSPSATRTCSRRSRPCWAARRTRRPRGS